VITGGFDAEYGRVMSGIVKIVTREGGSSYSGAAEYITDKPSGRNWLNTPSFGYQNADLAFGGLIYSGDRRLSFFTSGEWRNQDDSRPRWGVKALDFERELLSGESFNMLANGRQPHNGLSGWTFQGKLSSRVSENTTLKAGFLGSRNDRKFYKHSYRYNLSHAPVALDNNTSFFAELTWTLGSKTFFTLGAHSFSTQYKLGDGVHFNRLFEYARPPTANTPVDDEALFWLNNGLDSSIQRSDNGFVTHGDGSIYNEFLQRESFYITPIDFDLTSQLSSNHQVKIGFDLQLHRMRYYHHIHPEQTYLGPYRSPKDPGGFAAVNRYGYSFQTDGQEIVPLTTGIDQEKHPILSSVYLQDKMEYEGLVVNLGMRLDYFNPRTQTYVQETQPLGDDSSLDPEDLTGYRAFTRFSPRMGIGFPISDRTVLHANYGVFYQQPNLEYLYVGFEFLDYYMLKGQNYTFGNPNLLSEQTQAYEIGVNRQMSERATLSVTMYHKSTRDLVQVAAVPA